MTQQSKNRIRFDRIALILAALIVAGIVTYRFTTKPGGTAMSSATAAQSAPQTLADLEKNTTDHPDDSEAWRNLGVAYYSEQRFADAVRAYDRAATLKPDDAALWSALGEARVMASDHDPMPADAAAAFTKALELDPKDSRARYFDAVRKDLTGDHEAALTQWLALLADTPSDAPWHNDLVRTIDQVGKINKIDVADRIATAQTQAPAPSSQAASMPKAAQAIPGPTQQDLARASAMRPDDQQAMVQGMVERLENRLKDDPSNVDGWIMLMRSRTTLNEPDKAARALSDAIAANPAKADYLRQQAGVLGIR
ncbi:tetratricopeptide repeat protein [Novosphingobium album (ex Hu et al. 2023)]|uniref:Tetratricopeptide repeat protein n=1 Tax=Novosphingobium album (ex Hu et al. 2023) TaxID=2930093 RepID=A0ABT0AXH1_9SPHN|nr:tetratricopeptide repeat protein [Novosphingobium album (ex Hu et al. 2023)]MCJ2177505.1 tetratricopeptide repeat protein [Novosphingobium album (ex Hu et al. 2023)]